MIETVENFVDRYFIQPGYDWVDTPTYGILLALGAFLIIKILKKLNVIVNRRLVLSLLPFIFYGATTRELAARGFGIYRESFWLVSPGIYVSVFAAAFATLLLGLFLNKKLGIPHTSPLVVVGGLLSAYNFLLIIIYLRNITPMLLVFGLTALWFLLLFLIIKKFKADFLKFEYNYAVVLAHLFDASATFVGVDLFSYGEQHVLPSFLIGFTKTASVMFPLKLIVVIPVLYLTDRWSEDALTRRFIKFVMLVLGLGPGIRDVVMLILA